MEIIGVTGKSGSGKSTFASLLSEKLNCKYIDIDEIGHQSLSQPDILYKLCDKFGTEILNENGNLDRKKIGNMVFSDKDKMKELEFLTWDYMQKTLDAILLQDDEIVVLDWILLPQSIYWNKCNLKILVTSNDTDRKNKVLERDNISSEYFDKRDSASINYSYFSFDYIFENDYNLQNINNMVNLIISQYN